MKFHKEFFELCKKATEELGLDKGNAAKTYTSIKSYLMWKYDQMHCHHEEDIILKERVLNLRSDEINNAKKNLDSRYRSNKSNFNYPYFRFGKNNELVFDKVLEYLKDDEIDIFDRIQTGDNMFMARYFINMCISAAVYYGMSKSSGGDVAKTVIEFIANRDGDIPTMYDSFISVTSSELHSQKELNFGPTSALIFDDAKERLKKVDEYLKKFKDN